MTHSDILISMYEDGEDVEFGQGASIEECDGEEIPRCMKPLDDMVDADTQLGLHEVSTFNPNGERYWLNQSENPDEPDYVELTYAQYRYHRVCGHDVMHDSDVALSQYFDWSGDNPVILSEAETADAQRSEGGWSDLARTDNSHVRGKTVSRMRRESSYVAWVRDFNRLKHDPAKMQAMFSQLWAQYKAKGWESFMNRWDVNCLMNTFKKHGAKSSR